MLLAVALITGEAVEARLDVRQQVIKNVTAVGGGGGRSGGGGRDTVPAMFVFGDSLIDNGNNNDLPSLAKANYFPYGIDFNGGPTGRFSNGYTMVDEIGSLVTIL